MNVRKLPPQRLHLTAYNASEVFEPITPWLSSLEVVEAIRGVVTLASKTGNFQCRLAIQSAVKSERDAVAPTSLGAYPTQMTAAGSELFVSFDPNGAADGNIDSGMLFRIGFLYSLSAGTTPGVGTVIAHLQLR